MKRNLLLLIAFVLVQMAQAQTVPQPPPAKGNGRITAVVKDSTIVSKAPVEFASIALVDQATGKPVDGAMCDEKGRFTLTKIPHGQYLLAISFIGFETRTIRNINISENKTEIDLGTVNIGQSAKVLKEVTVEGQKAMVEEKVDRTVYNAENDQTTRGGDATDVLKRVPMLSVDLDGNVSLRGSQNIKVLINNKPSTITASSVADALKQIPADQIKTVEVITSPSAKYDAEGSAGIINIITKKNTMQGFSLNVDGSTGFRGSNLSLNGGYRKGKLGISLGGFGRAGYNINGTFGNTQSTVRDTVRTVNQQNAGTRSTNIGGNYTLGLDYDINKHNNLTGSVRFGGRDNFAYQNLLHTQAFTYYNDLLFRSVGNTRNVKTTDLSNTLDMNMTYTRSFDKPQREFSLMALFSRNNRTNDFSSNTLNYLQMDSLRAKNINSSYNQEFAVQADFQTPLSTNQILEFGGKNTMRTVSSNYNYFVATGNSDFVPNNNPLQPSNVFDYKQNISAGYFSYTLSLPAGYTFKAGSRYEYTTIDAHFKNISIVEGSTNIPSYGVLVPSANFSKKLKNGNVLKVAYNRRIQRPSIQFLNPNQQFSNQLSVSQGNSHLGPEYTNNFELAYSTFVGGSSFNFSTFMRNTNNSIQSIRKPYHNSKDTILTTYENIGKENAYGFSFFTGINVSNKVNINGGTDVYYAVLNNNVSDPIYNAHNQGWVYNFRLMGSYTIGKGWGAQFFGFYRGRQVQLQGFQGGYRVYSLSFKKDLLNKKGSIGFGAENFVTPALKIVSTTRSAVVNQQSTTIFHNLNFKVTLSFRIGKMSFDQPKRRSKSISDDDLKDAGGDNNPSGGGAQGGSGQAAPAGGGMPAGNGQRGAQPAKTGWQKPDSTNQKRDTTGVKKNWNPKGNVPQKKDSVIRKTSSIDSPVPYNLMNTLNPNDAAIITADAQAILFPAKKEKKIKSKALPAKQKDS